MRDAAVTVNMMPDDWPKCPKCGEELSEEEDEEGYLSDWYCLECEVYIPHQVIQAQETPL